MLKWCGRNRSATAAIAVSALAAIVVVAVSLCYALIVRGLNYDLNDALATSERLRGEAEDARNEAVSRAEQLRRERYIQDMRVAYEAWRSHDLRPYQDALSRYIPEGQDSDLRGMEWHFLRKLGQTSSFVIDEFSSAQYSISFAPTGDVFAVCGEDGVVRILDATDYRHLLEFDAGQGEVNQATFGPQGRRLATAGDDGSVQIWDWKTQEKLLSQAHGDLAFNARFTPDGESLVTCGRESPIHVWDASSGELLFTLEGHKDNVQQLALTSDGARLASCSDDATVRLWDLRGRQQLAAFQM